jgi:hypothetical protein
MTISEASGKSRNEGQVARPGLSEGSYADALWVAGDEEPSPEHTLMLCAVFALDYSMFLRAPPNALHRLAALAITHRMQAQSTERQIPNPVLSLPVGAQWRTR